MASVFDAFGVGIYCLDREGRFGYLNPAAETLLGWRAAELLGRFAHDLIHHSQADGSPLPREECPFYQAVRRGATRRELNDLFWRKDGSAVPVVYTLAPLHDDDEEHVGAIVMFADESERRRDTALLGARTAQQAALAELGLRALGAGALQDLFQHASALVARMLNAEFSQVLKLIDEQQGLQLVAGVGWRAGTEDATQVRLDRESQAGFALATDRSVVVHDWRTETRFSAAPLLSAHGVISGVSVVIHGRDRPWGSEPWGIVGAHSRLGCAFSAEDVNFLESVANTLALAIERRETEEELWQRNAEMARLTGELTRLADERRRIMADALDAEDHTRERISQLLHDEVLQNLLSARQDLAKARRNRGEGDHAVGQAAEAVVEAISELRSAVVALHPVTRTRGGIAAAIRAVADMHAARGGFDVVLKLQPQAGGFHDQLIVSLVRELLANVAQHAEARQVTISLRRTRGHVLLDVADNGRGMGTGRPEEALAQGHVGLASIAMRVESYGGRFELSANRPEGTRARALLPAAPAGGSSRSRAAYRG